MNHTMTTDMVMHHMHHQDHTFHILLFGIAILIAGYIGVRENYKHKKHEGSVEIKEKTK